MKFSGGFFYVVTTNIAFSIRIMFYKKTVILKTTTGLSLYFQLVNLNIFEHLGYTCKSKKSFMRQKQSQPQTIWCSRDESHFHHRRFSFMKESKIHHCGLHFHERKVKLTNVHLDFHERNVRNHHSKLHFHEMKSQTYHGRFNL